jgi:hypothetical protein
VPKMSAIVAPATKTSTAASRPLMIALPNMFATSEKGFVP